MPKAIDLVIPLTEHAARRKRVRTVLKDSIGLVFAGEHDPHLDHTYRPHPHFEYLTGIVNEPGAVLLFDHSNPVEARRELLFLRPLDPEVERWDGFRPEIGKDLRDRTGFRTVFRMGQLANQLNIAARRCRSLACLHPTAAYDRPVSRDLEIFRKVAERVPGTSIDDHTELVPKLRSVKSPAEVAMIEQAIEITRLGFAATLAAVRPGISEFDVQETIEHAYRSQGSRGPAFGSIAGSGFNSTVLHYRANDRIIEDGDLICIDSGARFGGYGADITRTVPANGAFTDRQRAVYDVVLHALEAATAAVKPVARLADIDRVARAIITKAGFGDAFIHGIGHHLGLETHDAAPDEPLPVGAVITIEPGIYLRDERIGIRIEDDVLVTKEGRRVLSAKIPRKAKDVEGMMG